MATGAILPIGMDGGDGTTRGTTGMIRGITHGMVAGTLHGTIMAGTIPTTMAAMGIIPRGRRDAITAVPTQERATMA